ncbi:putative muramidase [Aspergillus terreus]|uniref:Putative muramidase n=1 Tax=Aspergillus terreus TaxID=33178 RepID=A0A5M3Z773_ASPTE|nr:hypothetical protein ATETN484_0008051200 [Aspergillus terreus]GFF21340.1 putative muramidase [Aspergillus terreus]
MVPKMTAFRILLSILLGVVSLSHGASTTWDALPSRPTTPGVVPNCNKWYTIQKGDTCFSVTTAFGISMDDFLRWNPSVSADCLVNFWADTSYCVGVGPVESTTTKANGPRPTTTITTTITTTSDESTTKATGPRPTTTITTTITTTPISTTDTTDSSYTFINPITSWNVTTTPVETAWPPTRTQEGQAKNCNRWHRVRAGETCESIHAQYDSWMTFENLLEWNPALKEDCRYPWVGWWVCVGVKPTTTFSISYPPQTPPPMVIPSPTTTSPDPPEETARPTQPGIAPNCQDFHKAEKGDTCEKILKDVPLLKEDDLHKWNPALGPDCKGLIPGYYYCVAAYGGGWLPMPPTVTKVPSPTATGIISNCVSWYKRTYGETCDDIVRMFGTFSVKEFLKWNSDLTENCVGLQDDYWYCVGVPGTPTTRTAPVATTPLSNGSIAQMSPSSGPVSPTLSPMAGYRNFGLHNLTITGWHGLLAPTRGVAGSRKFTNGTSPSATNSSMILSAGPTAGRI